MLLLYGTVVFFNRYKDDALIPKDDYSYQVLYLRDGTISLEIFYPKADKDAAIFKCEAQNEKGVAISESKVTVISKSRYRRNIWI